MKRKNIFWGIFFIAATILLIASQLGAYKVFGFWSVLGTIVLVAIIIQSIMSRVWFGLFLPIALLYLIYQQPLSLMYISPWVLIAGAILISIGFHFIFRSKISHNCHHHSNKYTFTDSSGNENENTPVVELSFGNMSKYLHSQQLEGGSFTCSFGNLEIYFDGVELLNNKAEIFIKCSFGELKLFIPKHFSVIDKVAVSMGDFEIQNSPIASEKNVELTINGSVSMGHAKVIFI